MTKVSLGETGIMVSRLGIGTGTEHPTGCTVQSLMPTRELAGLLLHAHDRGINLWDTAHSYGTYPHIREALNGVRREDVVLVTKMTFPSYEETVRGIEDGLRKAGTDYFDVCLMHGVRTAREFRARRGSLDAMLRLREQGKVRAVGLSSHGLGALSHCLEVPEMEVVWARVNYAGVNMDSPVMGLYDRLAAVPLLRRAYGLIPGRLRSRMRGTVQSVRLSEEGRRDVVDILRSIHVSRRGVVGMKVMGAGTLADDAAAALRFSRGLPFVDCHVIGMLSRAEVDMNCDAFED